MKAILFSLLLFIIIRCLNAQQDFAPIGGEWYYCIPDIVHNDPRYDYENFIVVDDTIVDGKNCRLIKSNKDSTLVFYEENDKVFYYQFNHFNLIYDFAAIIGDTVEFDFPAKNNLYQDTVISAKAVLKSKDSVDIQNINIFKFNWDVIQPPGYEYLVWPSTYSYLEAVGNEIHILYKIIPPSVDRFYRLRCYNDNLISYKSPFWEGLNIDCDYKLNTSISQNKSDELFCIYPNPSNGYLRISLDNLNIRKAEIELYNISGILLKKLSVFNEGVIIDNLLPGLYLIKIKGNINNTYFESYNKINVI
jgi:hypothetical protein